MPSTRQIVQLYRDLIRYGNNLKLTDKEYYFNRIHREFRKNQNLENPKEITFSYEVSNTKCFTYNFFKLYRMR